MRGPVAFWAAFQTPRRNGVQLHSLCDCLELS